MYLKDKQLGKVTEVEAQNTVEDTDFALHMPWVEGTAVGTVEGIPQD